MIQRTHSWCIYAALTGCMTLTIQAQQPVLRDLTRPELTREIAPQDYWTPERMAAAIPRTQAVAPTGGSRGNVAPAPDSPVGSEPGAMATMDPLAAMLGESPVADMDAEGPKAGTREAGVFNSYPYPFTRHNTVPVVYNGAATSPYPLTGYRAIGKLFFTLGGSNYVCSASVIRRHLVLTARHCILDATRGWATNVVFAPGYYAGTNPRLRLWRARRLASWGFGGSGAGLKWDIGFIQTFDSDNIGCNGSAGGTPIEGYTGYLGYMYGGNVADRNYTSFGYPAAAPFNGLYMVQAHSDVGNINPLNQPGTFSMGNDMTGGSSGGPWIVGWGSTYYVNGLNSYKWINPARPLEMNSPNFQADNFYNLLVYANGLSCP